MRPALCARRAAATAAAAAAAVRGCVRGGRSVRGLASSRGGPELSARGALGLACPRSRDGLADRWRAGASRSAAVANTPRRDSAAKLAPRRLRHDQQPLLRRALPGPPPLSGPQLGLTQSLSEVVARTIYLFDPFSQPPYPKTYATLMASLFALANLALIADVTVNGLLSEEDEEAARRGAGKSANLEEVLQRADFAARMYAFVADLRPHVDAAQLPRLITQGLRGEDAATQEAALRLLLVLVRHRYLCVHLSDEKDMFDALAPFLQRGREFGPEAGGEQHAPTPLTRANLLATAVLRFAASSQDEAAHLHFSKLAAEWLPALGVLAARSLEGGLSERDTLVLDNVAQVAAYHATDTEFCERFRESALFQVARGASQSSGGGGGGGSGGIWARYFELAVLQCESDLDVVSKLTLGSFVDALEEKLALIGGAAWGAARLFVHGVRKGGPKLGLRVPAMAALGSFLLVGLHEVSRPPGMHFGAQRDLPTREALPDIRRALFRSACLLYVLHVAPYSLAPATVAIAARSLFDHRAELDALERA